MVDKITSQNSGGPRVAFTRARDDGQVRELLDRFGKQHGWRVIYKSTLDSKAIIGENDSVEDTQILDRLLVEGSLVNASVPGDVKEPTKFRGYRVNGGLDRREMVINGLELYSADSERSGDTVTLLADSLKRYVTEQGY